MPPAKEEELCLFIIILALFSQRYANKKSTEFSTSFSGNESNNKYGWRKTKPFSYFYLLNKNDIYASMENQNSSKLLFLQMVSPACEAIICQIVIAFRALIYFKIAKWKPFWLLAVFARQ